MLFISVLPGRYFSQGFMHHYQFTRSKRTLAFPVSSVRWIDALRGRGFLDIEVDPGEVKGTKLRVLKYPHPQLRQQNEVITEINNEIKQLAEEMLMVMYAAEGIGLAAPQVGRNVRLMVFNELGEPSKKEKEMILINPQLKSKSDDTDDRQEGCLSFPQINGIVSRSLWVDVEYTNVKGETSSVRLSGLPARIFQHEYDHLDKILFIDRMRDEDKKINAKRLEKYVKKYGPGAAP